jgi:histidine triad (HIT) family protein
MPMIHIKSTNYEGPVPKTLADAPYFGTLYFVFGTCEGGFDMMSDNIFLKIVEKKIPARIVHEDEHCVAFHDITPQAPVHVLIIPRKVIPTHADIKDEDRELLGHLHLVAAQLAEKLNLGDGYRLVLNCKESAGQTVPHLHLHLLGGRHFQWPPG